MLEQVVGSDHPAVVLVRTSVAGMDEAIKNRQFSQIKQDEIELVRETMFQMPSSISEAWSAFEGATNAVRSMQAFGLTAPLVTKADGGKFGKTESGAIWLTADRTSPYAYYQFWLNASDADAANWIKVFTFLDQPTIESIIARHAENPGARELQRTLAQEATRILHGQSAMEQAEAAGKALFSGDISSLDEATLREVLADVPSSEKDRADLSAGYDAVDLLVETELAKSKREAREFIANGSVTVNGVKLAPDTPLTQNDLLHGSLMAIRRGKKNWHLIRWS